MSQRPLQELICDMRSSDPQHSDPAFAEVMLRYTQKILDAVRHHIQHPSIENATDACQEAFTAFYVAVRDGKWKDAGDPLPWLIRVALNKEVNRYKKQHQKQTRQLTDEVGATLPSRTDTTVEDRDESDDLVRRIAKIPEQHRVVVELYYLQCLSIEEVAERLGLSYTKVQSLLHKARLALRRSYGIPERIAPDAQATANTTTAVVPDGSEDSQTEVKQ